MAIITSVLGWHKVTKILKISLHTVIIQQSVNVNLYASRQYIKQLAPVLSWNTIACQIIKTMKKLLKSKRSTLYALYQNFQFCMLLYLSQTVSLPIMDMIY